MITAVSGIVGMISLLGDVHWSVMLALPSETATALAAAFAGFVIDYDSEDMGDLVGEIVNVLAGDVLLRLEGLGVAADMSLPAIMRGTAMGVMLPDQKPLLVTRFTSDHGPFELVVGARAC
jgi:CheY-specific phosphatase CheX